MKTAVVILNYNSADDCRVCVETLKKQQGAEFEIVIVDNCSKPEERSAVENLCREESCTFIANNENRGYNAGNNVGLRYAAEHGFDYALVANPDMIFNREDCLKTLAEVMGKDAEIAMCGCDVLTPEGVHQNPKKTFTRHWLGSFWWVSYIFHRRKKTEIPDWVDQPESSHYCVSLHGCCLLLRVSFLKQIGFFDERTFLFGEEPILARQVELSGKKAFYTAETQVIHNHRKSKEGKNSIRLKHWKNSQLLYNWYYSGYPFYGKCFAAVSIHLYFMALNFVDKRRGA